MGHGLETMQRLNDEASVPPSADLDFANKVSIAVEAIASMRLRDAEIVALSVYGACSLICVHVEWEAFKRIRTKQETCDPMASTEGSYHHSFYAGAVEFRAIATEFPG